MTRPKTFRTRALAALAGIATLAAGACTTLDIAGNRWACLTDDDCGVNYFCGEGVCVAWGAPGTSADTTSSGTSDTGSSWTSDTGSSWTSDTGSSGTSDAGSSWASDARSSRDSDAGSSWGPDAGGPTCEGVGAELRASELDLVGDGACDPSLFWDVDCVNQSDGSFAFTCGKSKCDFTLGVCESMQPCGEVRCALFDGYPFAVARPCPNDPDCMGSNGEPAVSCAADGHCDEWCPLDRTGASLDPDCSGGLDSAPYCPGGTKAGQCL